MHLYDVNEVTSGDNNTTSLMGYGRNRSVIVSPSQADLNTIHAR